jgi:hypothetical protein
VFWCSSTCAAAICGAKISLNPEVTEVFNQGISAGVASRIEQQSRANISLSNNSTLILTQNSSLGYTFDIPQVTITGNSTINADVNRFKYFYPLKVTGDGTGTINVSGNGQSGALGV